MNKAIEYFVDINIDWTTAKKMAEAECPKGFRIWSERGIYRIQKLLWKKYPEIMHDFQLKRKSGYLDNKHGFIFYK